MGHNLTARTKGKTIATLRISGRRRRETKIYQTLGVNHLNRGDSGSGETAIIPRETLNRARKNIQLTHDERHFVENCLTANDVEIEFS